ncbi:uncharacterized protein LOC126898298 [Daktulosphaira vitifoliae]|uniref:uncharacterized protein LOC126898298 n=1 Tax=Daktulosphaira vitifoliae TaxID=58002 RepID=UPI0021AA9EB3|nr:uncharacterized protein LOC126898298 [Daktulosphaira vitifoliae]
MMSVEEKFMNYKPPLLPENLAHLPDRVANSFAGKTIFITGGSGFLGMVLIEKLLRKCTDIKKIYLLLRPKKGKDPMQRLEDLFSSELFNYLKELQGTDFIKKISVVAGDIAEINLGIQEDDRKILIDEVNIVYHAAATVRFDEPLKKAVFLNTRGTKFALELSKKMKKLEVFVYVSTAYCHPSETELQEKIYNSPVDPHKIILSMEIMENKYIENISKQIVGDFPNSYAFTKCLAEQLVAEQIQSGMPCMITRPSVVISIWKEPLPGWALNKNGPVGLFIAAGKGIVRTMYCNNKGYADFIPVDTVTNGLVLSVWNYLENKDTSKNVFNLTSCKELRVTWQEIIEKGREILKEIPLNGCVWYPGGSFKSSKFLQNLCAFFLHTMPAYFLDALIYLSGHKPCLVNINDRINKGFEVFEYYTNNVWDFRNDNLRYTRTIMNERENFDYNVNVSELDVISYMKNNILGCRVYLMKEPHDTLPAARRHLKRMYYVDLVTKIILFGLVFAFFYSWSETIIAAILMVLYLLQLLFNYLTTIIKRDPSFGQGTNNELNHCHISVVLWSSAIRFQIHFDFLTKTTVMSTYEESFMNYRPPTLPENLSHLPDRVSKTFANKTIFITGGSGFLGKVLLEKLLRKSRDIKRIYLLLRPKKGKDPKQRIEALFSIELFNYIKELQGEKCMNKVIPISGDVSKINLGLTPEDYVKLSEEVNIVFNMAATIRFDEPLKKAVLINTRGTKYTLELANEMKNLELFVHVSTAYCHLNEKVLYEKVYPPPADPHKIIKTMEILEDHYIDSITKQIIGIFPNTYAFTKSLSEHLVVEQMQAGLPCIITRPSVVIPIWNEPLPGWTDNMNGPIGLLIGAGKGVIRSMYCDNNGYEDFYPVDITVNALLVYAWNYIANKDTAKSIYHLTSGNEIKVSYQDLIDITKEIAVTEIPLNGCVWYPGGSLKKSRFVHNISAFFFHTIPAYLLDALIFLSGNKPCMRRIQDKINKGFEVFEYYANNQWDFRNDHVTHIRKILNDRENFEYNVRYDNLVIRDYIKNCVMGARVYILKEMPDTLPSARRHIKLMYYVDIISKLLLLALLFWTVFKWSDIIIEISSFILDVIKMIFDLGRSVFKSNYLVNHR